MYKVSVIIPIYNVAEYLPKCLDSVVNQTYKNLEIICVNDCSPDNCDKILQDYAAKDERIKIINRETNGGLSAARNSGMEVATGEYIYFIDSDDWIDNDYIEQMVQAATNNNAEVVVNTNILTEEGKTPQQHLPQNTENFVQDKFLDAQSCIFNIIWNTWAYLWKKSFLDRINAKFPEGYVIEDMYFQATTLPFVDKIYVIRKSAYHYLQRNNSIMGTITQILYVSRLKILDKIYDYYQENRLLDKIKICMIPHSLYPNSLTTKENMQLLRTYFYKIQKFVNYNRDIYSKTALLLFDDVLNNFDKATATNYQKIARLEQLRNNIKNHQNTKKRCSIPIFLAADNNYAPFVATTIASVCDNTKSFCNFYILDSGISDENKERIGLLKNKFNNFDIEYLKIDTEKYFSNFRSCVEHLSISTYNRFLIHKFKPEFAKCIYLDVDTITLIDIKDLYDTDMEGYPIAARPAVWLPQEELRSKFKLNKDYKYFNAGVLLLNNDLWNKDKIFDKLLEIENQYRDLLGDADQGCLNIYCNKNGGYKRIDDIYNIPPTHFAYKDKAILHFLNDDKPWYFTPDFGEFEYIPATRRINEFWHYAKLTPFYDDILKRIKYSPENDMLKLRVKSIVFKENKKLREALALSQK